jgi:hypothetical protein
MSVDNTYDLSKVHGKLGVGKFKRDMVNEEEPFNLPKQSVIQEGVCETIEEYERVFKEFKDLLPTSFFPTTQKDEDMPNPYDRIKLLEGALHIAGTLLSYSCCPARYNYQGCPFKNKCEGCDHVIENSPECWVKCLIHHQEKEIL